MQTTFWIRDVFQWVRKFWQVCFGGQFDFGRDFWGYSKNGKIHDRKKCFSLYLVLQLRLENPAWDFGGFNFFFLDFASSPRDFLGCNICHHLHLPVTLNPE